VEERRILKSFTLGRLIAHSAETHVVLSVVKSDSWLVQ